MKTAEKKISLGWARALRDLRDAIGESQQGMAKRIGVSYRGYRFWEQGKRVPGGKWFAKLRALEMEAGIRKLEQAEIFGNALIAMTGEVPRLTQADSLVLQEALKVVTSSGSPDLAKRLKGLIHNMLGAESNPLDIPKKSNDNPADINHGKGKVTPAKDGDDPQPIQFYESTTSKVRRKHHGKT